MANKEALTLFFNLILISRIQPSDWSSKRTTLISKQGEDLSKIKKPYTNYYRLHTLPHILGDH
jgi:hypothetical protein